MSSQIAQYARGLQDVLVNVRKQVSLEEEVERLRDETARIKGEYAELQRDMVAYGQGLVSTGQLVYGLEPYVCAWCSRVTPGNEIVHVYRHPPKRDAPPAWWAGQSFEFYSCQACETPRVEGSVSSEEGPPA